MERTIEAATTVRATLPRVRDVLVTDPGSVLLETCTEDQRRSRTFPVDLVVEIGGGASIHQQVSVRLGVAKAADQGVELPVRWTSTGRQQLYPMFDGRLEAIATRGGTELRLTGTYEVPLGAFGRFGDGVAGHRLARRSAQVLLTEIGLRLVREVSRRLDARPWHMTPSHGNALPAQM